MLRTPADLAHRHGMPHLPDPRTGARSERPLGALAAALTPHSEPGRGTGSERWRVVRGVGPVV
ncbi:MAG: hypothetical protein L0I24_11395, partial [Pseudonocardia sp.]|nr:hypothetical protein [Pseudonocardia sp.]